MRLRLLPCATLHYNEYINRMRQVLDRLRSEYATGEENILNNILLVASSSPHRVAINLLTLVQRVQANRIVSFSKLQM